MLAAYRKFSLYEVTGEPNWIGHRRRKYADSDEMFADIAAFLTELGPERIISVCNLESDEAWAGGAIIWYWE